MYQYPELPAMLAFVERLRRLIVRGPRVEEAPEMETPTKRSPADPNPVVLLETALGSRLRSLAEAATGRARAGMAPGRAGRHYGSAYEAGVDHRLESLEEERDTAQRELAAALAIVEASDVSRILGVDGEAQRRAEIARAYYDEVDARIATIVALGRPLAQRAHLLDLFVGAEAELVAVDGEHKALLPLLKWAQSPESDDYVIPGQPAKKRAHIEKERLARERLDAAEAATRDARFALRRWADEHREIAVALDRSASR
jgi:hypothetical protein